MSSQVFCIFLHLCFITFSKSSLNIININSVLMLYKILTKYIICLLAFLMASFAISKLLVFIWPRIASECLIVLWKFSGIFSEFLQLYFSHLSLNISGIYLLYGLRLEPNFLLLF